MRPEIVEEHARFPPWLASLLPRGYRRFQCRMGDQSMHFMEWGDANGLPILMQHGNPTWGFLYRKVVGRLLGKGFRLITPDLIGLGFSSKPLTYRVHTLKNHAQWLGALIDSLELSQIVFVGQDWGAPIGTRMLADRPHLMKAMVLMNTVVSPPGESFRPTAFHRFANKPFVSDATFRILGYPQRALGRAQGDPTSISGNVARAYRFPLRGILRNAAPLALARMVPSHSEHPSVPELKRCAEYLAGFTGPVAIVWGDKDPVLGRTISRIEKQFPQADIARTGGGHFIQEEFAGLIATKIESVAKSAGLL